jgi:hypothetical protein
MEETIGEEELKSLSTAFKEVAKTGSLEKDELCEYLKAKLNTSDSDASEIW